MKHPHKKNVLPLPSDPIVPEVVNEDEERENAFIRYLFLGLGVTDAASKAGYSKSYAESAVYQKFKSPRFQDKIRDYAVSTNAQTIPKVCDLYRIAVNQLYKEAQNGELENLSKLRHIPRQILEIGRILTPEQGQVANYVNIEQIQAVITNNIKAAAGEENKD